MSDPVGADERYPWLAPALRDDALVLTASRRLARELRVVFDLQQRASGLVAWPTPGVMFWQDWVLERLIPMSDANSARPIGATAASILWEQSIRRHIHVDVPRLSSLVRQASAAWQRSNAWRVPLAAIVKAARSHDQLSFARAAQDYQRTLTDANWIDREQMPAALADRLHAGQGDVPRRALLAGFDRIMPSVARLVDALRERGTDARFAPRARRSDSVQVQSFIDDEAELRAAGRWARDVLAAHPDARVAIVSPDLDTQAPRHARLIREGLAPGWQTSGDAYQHAVNVSFGRRLADYPAVSVALLCLRWITRGLPSRDVSVLLRSPCLGGDDPSARARAERRLRELPDRQWTAAALADALADVLDDVSDKTPAGPLVPQWLANVRRIAEMQIASAARRPPSAWAENIDRLLVSVGWPGEHALRSDEFQLINRWRELLNELAAMNLVLPELTLGEAVARLHALARDTVYQPEQRPGLVDLVGTLEAAGMEFDYLWVAGLDAGRWPPPGNPLALVSRRLQVDYGMPDASPADTLEYSQRVVDRLAASARVVRFSFARTAIDAVQSPSPLLQRLAAASDAGATDPGWYASALIDQAAAAAVVDDPVPAVDGIETLAGGASTVGLQRSEPIAAFAAGRLGVRELVRFQAGISPPLRGVLLHDTLCELYAGKPSQDMIDGWTDRERRERISRAVDRCLSRAERHADAVLRRLLALERVRLRRVIHDLLVVDAKRQAFRIERVEERMQFVHAGLRLKLRADRIDRLGDGTLLIIDYKTGTAKNLLDAHGDPLEPQLAVYAVALAEGMPERIGGIALLNVSRRGIEYKAAGASIEWRPLSPDDWHEALHRWKAQVLSAIEAIAGGDVRVNLRRDSSHRWQLDVLSRVEELRRAG